MEALAGAGHSKRGALFDGDAVHWRGLERPAGADLPTREPGRSEFITRVEAAASALSPGGGGEVRFPVSLYLRKSDEEGGKQSDLPATARALRELHVKWQEVAEAPRHSAQRLWDRFRTATDFIRARCETYFAQLREERTTNLQKKAALVEEAEALAASSDWSRTAGRLQELQAA